MKVISRAEAKEQGLKRYFTGEPCKRGHVDERIVSSFECCECNRIKANEHHKNNREASLKKMAERRAKPESRAANAAYLAAYRVTPEARAARAAWHKERYATDPVYAIAKRARNLVSDALIRHGFRKTCCAEEILGCTIAEFKRHIEKQFKDGMSWENRSKWELDHIIPIASATTQDEALALNRFTNLRPLWKKANRAKSALIEYLI